MNVLVKNVCTLSLSTLTFLCPSQQLPPVSRSFELTFSVILHGSPTDSKHRRFCSICKISECWLRCNLNGCYFSLPLTDCLPYLSNRKMEAFVRIQFPLKYSTWKKRQTRRKQMVNCSHVIQ